MKQTHHKLSRRSFITSFFLLLLILTLAGCKNLSYTSVQPLMEKEPQQIESGCSVGVQESEEEYEIKYVKINGGM